MEQENKGEKMATKELKYLKEDILASKTIDYNKDVLMVVLEDGEYYTKKEIEKKYKEFMNREVK